MDTKKLVAEAAADRVQDGMIVGLGTGTTAAWAIRRIGARVKEGLSIQAIATSLQSERLAVSLGIPLTSFANVDRLDLTIDGADEVDDRLHLIKGGGGALLREKIVAAASRQLLIVVDESKLVRELGRFPLPVEVVPFGVENTISMIEALGCTAAIRMEHDAPFVSDNGHFIVDCAFEGRLTAPESLEARLNAIPGVVENGLFIGMAHQVLVGGKDGTIRTLLPLSP